MLTKKKPEINMILKFPRFLLSPQKNKPFVEGLLIFSALLLVISCLLNTVKLLCSFVDCL